MSWGVQAKVGSAALAGRSQLLCGCGVEWRGCSWVCGGADAKSGAGKACTAASPFGSPTSICRNGVTGACYCEHSFLPSLRAQLHPPPWLIALGNGTHGSLVGS